MTFIHMPLFTATLCMTIAIHAKMVEFAENTYAMQAPTELIALAHKAAERIGFTDAYEIAVPKKAGLTGWNRFAVGGSNTQTKNAYVLVNPSWFNQIPEEQQIFLLARAMLFHTHGIASPYSTYITILAIFFSLLSIISLFWLLGKTPLITYNPAFRLILAYLITIGLEKLITQPLLSKVQAYAGLQHDIFVSRLTAEKLGDRDAAIKALERYDASIKEAVSNGEALFKPFEHTFAQIIAGLQK